MADATTEQVGSTFKVTLKAETFEIDIAKLTGHERFEAKRLLEVESFEIVQLFRDPGVYVLAYLAAKRRRPTLAFADVLDLGGDELQIELVGAPDADPFGGSAKAEPKGKNSSDKGSTPG